MSDLEEPIIVLLKIEVLEVELEVKMLLDENE